MQACILHYLLNHELFMYVINCCMGPQYQGWICTVQFSPVIWCGIKPAMPFSGVLAAAIVNNSWIQIKRKAAFPLKGPPPANDVARF